MNKYFRLLLTFTTFCFLGMLFALYKYYNLRIAFKNQGYTNIYKPNELQPKTTQEIIKLTFIETETVQKIYQMFKDTVDLFEKLNIRYSIDGGSIIAIVRNKGLLP